MLSYKISLIILIISVTLSKKLGAGYNAALGGNSLSGAIGGMVPEIVPELMSGADSTTIKSASKLTSGAASLMLGGKASDVNNAALISASSIEHNRRLHPEEQVILEQLQRGKTKEEQAKLAAAVAARIRAADGVEDSDPDKARLLAMQEQGADYAAESRQLDEALKASEALGKGPLFEYTATDKIQDFISRNDEHISRAIGGIKTGVGAVGAIASAGGATTGLGSAVAAVTGPLSAMYAKEGYEQAFGNYNSSEGEKVIESFNSSTPSYGEELGAKLATEAATTVAGAAIMKTAGMTLTHISPTLQKLASTTANIKQKAKTFKSTAVTYKNKRSTVKTLEKYGLRDKERNLVTAEKWPELATHIKKLEKKLPNTKDIKVKYPKQDQTFGVRYAWGKNYNNEVVLKGPKLDSEFAVQRIPYVSVKSNGTIKDKYGNFVVKKQDGLLYRELPKKKNPLAPDSKTSEKLPAVQGVDRVSKHPDVHIPVEEYKKWNKWYDK